MKKKGEQQEQTTPEMTPCIIQGNLMYVVFYFFY